MKKITITLIFTFVCNAALFSQEIDHTAYEKWVDFINCKYLKAYFDKKIDDTSISQIFRSDYNNRIKKVLADVNFENANLRAKMLVPLKSYPNGKILVEFIENKKADFDKSWDKSRLIEQLLALPTNQPRGADGSFNVFLKEEKAALKTYLQKELLPQNQQNIKIQSVVQDTLRKDTAVIQSATNVQNIQPKQNLIEKIPLKWVIIALCVIIMAVLFFIFKEKIKLKIVSNPEKIAGTGLLEKIAQLEKDNQVLTDKVFHICYKNDELRREIDKICHERDIAYHKIKELQNTKKEQSKLF
ncbi:MAG: hypothetical protein FWF72_06155 [Paludibacter sp.]|nr:hypothetical protein [Paludibacter sp.]